MTIDISKLAAASFMPGLQNSGQVTGEAFITGTLDASPAYPSNTSNLTNTANTPIVIELPDPSVISIVRINMPDATGDLASKWFPLIGTCELTDNTLNWKAIYYITSHPQGRAIYFNFVNTVNSGTTVNQHLNIYAHLFTYPWSQ